MTRDLLDSSILIHFWCTRRLGEKSKAEVQQEAQALIGEQGTDSILTPIYIEVVAGARTPRELELTQAFLAEFRIADEGEILKGDWLRAREEAERIPADGRKRQLPDCLIKAIAQRLGRRVVSLDRSFRPETGASSPA
jgi:predicted nucleic acid-binding protein